MTRKTHRRPQQKRTKRKSENTAPRQATGKDDLTRCPWCGRWPAAVLASDLFWCDWCQRMYDDKPFENGGDYSDGDPSGRLQREEERNHQSAPKRPRLR